MCKYMPGSSLAQNPDALKIDITGFLSIPGMYLKIGKTLLLCAMKGYKMLLKSHI